MPAPTQITDGAAVYGTQVITISATTYIAEDIRIERPVLEAHDKTRLGLPKNSLYTTDLASGTMTLQAPAGTSGRPAFGATFTMTVDDQYGSETWVLMPLGYQADNNPTDLRKMPVSFRQVINSIAIIS